MSHNSYSNIVVVANHDLRHLVYRFNKPYLILFNLISKKAQVYIYPLITFILISPISNYHISKLHISQYYIYYKNRTLHTYPNITITYTPILHISQYYIYPNITYILISCLSLLTIHK